MYYEIQSIETLDNGHTRTVVAFWADRSAYIRDRNKTNPLLTEDFITNVQPTGTRIVTDEDGQWKLADGTFVDPEMLDPEQHYEFEREEFEIDVAAILIDNIERFLEREREDGTTTADRIVRGDLRGDRTSAQLARREVPNRADRIRSRNVRDLIRNPREARMGDAR